MATNPILTELSSLSPGAQQALMQAHTATSATPAAPPMQPPKIDTGTRQAVAGLQAPGAPPPPAIGGSMGVPSMPNLSAPAPPIVHEAGKLSGDPTQDSMERSRLLGSGSGVSQISHKIEGSNFGQNHPGWGKVLGIGAQTLATIGDTAGRIAAPGLERMIPGTEGYHQNLLGKTNTALTGDINNAEKGAQTANEGATTAHTQAETAGLPQQQADTHSATGSRINLESSEIAEHNAQAAALLHPQAKTDFEAWQQQNPGKPIEEWLKTQQMAKGPKTIPPEQQYLTEYAQKHPGSTVAQAERQYMLDTQRPPQAPMVNMFVPGTQPGTETLQTVHPGQTIAAGAQTASGVNAVNTPTTTQRTAAGRAETVVAMAPQVIQEINAMGPDLGPIGGRWNDYMQGKVGTDNPQFAGLRADLLMMSSAVALAHAQGRLPENLREEFDRAINAPKQTAANLTATINHMLPWLVQMQHQGQPNSAVTSPSGGQPQQQQSSGGEPLVQHSPSTGQYRYSTDGGKTWQQGQPPTR